MKDNRLDEILVSLGYVTEDQIKRALHRQQERGGRLGTHLLSEKHVTESQLTRALSLQYYVAPFDPDRYPLAEDLVRKLPPDFTERHQVLPVAYNPSNGVLSVVVVDPQDEAAIAEIRRIIRCAELEIFVTPEATFAALVARHVRMEDGSGDGKQAIELPDLFDAREQAPTTAPAPRAVATDEDEAPGRVLLVSDRVFLRSFLEPVFEREGWRLITATDGEEVAEHLARGDVDRILVSRESAREFASWVRNGVVPRPRVDVSEFSTVSAALLDNHVPYAAMLDSLQRALRLVAETHVADGAESLPYDLLRADARELGVALDLPRLACDGLQLAALLIVPAVDLSDGEAEPGPHAIDWKRSLEQARSLRFPWPVDDLLKAFRELLSERVNLDEFCASDTERALAAQVLAVVWHHHLHCGRIDTDTADRTLALKTGLRAKSGRLARSEVVECYLGLIDRNAEEQHATAYHQLLVVGTDHRVLQQFTTRLRHLGYHPVRVADLEEVRVMCERHSPSAVVVHDASFPEEVLLSPKVYRTEAPVLLFALTEESDPSRILNFLDAGFDDVFSMPHDLDLIATRLRKSLRNAADAAAGQAPAGHFRAAFAALAFTDLLQTLSQSLKSVRISLTRGNGEAAVVHLEQGRPVHAVCGPVSGPEAIYAVIAWEEDGEFAVEPAETFPASNIEMPLESVLMEGCRLLDELRV